MRNKIIFFFSVFFACVMTPVFAQQYPIGARLYDQHEPSDEEPAFVEEGTLLLPAPGMTECDGDACDGESDLAQLNNTSKFQVTTNSNPADARLITDGNRNTVWRGQYLPDSVTLTAQTPQIISRYIMRMLIHPSSTYSNHQMIRVTYTPNGYDWYVLRSGQGYTSFHNCANGTNAGACATAFPTTDDVNGSIEVKVMRFEIYRHVNGNNQPQPSAQFSEIELH